MHDVFEKLVALIKEDALKFSLQAFAGLIILVISWIVSTFVARMITRSIGTKRIDITIVKFIAQAGRIAVLAVGVLMMLSTFGIQIAPIIAGLSVAGVGVGLALQGPLSNYASGITLIFTKPFKVGDIIEVDNFQGEVTDISLPRTELAGLDGSKIVIPNKHIIGEVVKNFSEYRRLEFNVGIAYDSDVTKALGIIESIIKSEERIPNKEVYKLGIKEFGESSVNLQAFVWVPQAKFTDVKFAINKAILTQFKSGGIVIPFPQREVRLSQKI